MNSTASINTTTTEEARLNKMRRERVRAVIGKLGWLSFAGYAVSSLCGAERIASATGLLAVACTATASGMKAAEDIHDVSLI
jgi:hypothetical protein